jgi:hypothetical protein
VSKDDRLDTNTGDYSMNKVSKLTLAATVAAAMLSSPAFAQAVQGNNVTGLNPNSPAATGGGSTGYNETQTDVDRS